jgi:hypothetical protein
MTPNQTSPTLAAMLGEVVGLLCVMAFYGPPVIFVLAPWLMLALLLSGPFAVVMTVVVALSLVGALLIGAAALLVTPVMMIRARRAAVASVAPPVQVRLPVAARWVAA